MSRFTDINFPYSVDPKDKRKDEEVLKDMEKKLGVKWFVHQKKHLKLLNSKIVFKLIF